jgi:membrane-associated phospholipid phosphatase
MRAALMRELAHPPTPLDKLVIALAATLVNAAMYTVPNHVQLRDPVLLRWTGVDAAVPFVPATVWIYVSVYLLVPTAFFWCRSWNEITRFTWAYLALLVTGSAVHLVWPTVFPRDAFPVEALGPTGQAIAFLRKADLPTSCLPSMHVAGSLLGALSLWRRRRLVFGAWMFWAGAITVSTLTLKQHYLIDVVGGAALAGSIWLAFFWLPGRQSPTSAVSSQRRSAPAIAHSSAGRARSSRNASTASPST